MVAHRRAAYGAVLALGACKSTGSEPDVANGGACLDPLVDHERWAQVLADADPFAPPEPERVRCGSDAVGFELLATEPTVAVDTADCSWATLEQPTLRAIAEGEPIAVRIWYFRQTATEPAQARQIVALDDEAIWEATVPLPTKSGIVAETFAAPRAAPAGTAIRWHVRNHGENSWNLIDLAIETAAPCSAE